SQGGGHDRRQRLGAPQPRLRPRRPARAGGDLRVRQGGPPAEHPRGPAAGGHRLRLRGPGRPGVPRLHHGDRPVAVHRHPVARRSQDTTKAAPGPGTLPNYDVWAQVIDEVRPNLVITTGTAGGIGTRFEVGDVVVSPVVRFDGVKWLKSTPFHDAVYTSGAPK